jgi:AbiJ N-terminal domain 4
MLTDIFAYRYLDFPIWKTFSEIERRLLNQLFGVVKEAIPYYDSDGKEIEANKKKWKTLHDRLSRELGVDELFSRYYSYTNKNHLGQSVPVSGFFGWDYACEKFVKSDCPIEHSDPDRFIKERVSFIELTMRWRYEEIETLNANLPKAILDAKIRDAGPKRGLRIPGSAVDGVKAWNKTQNEMYSSLIDEINERFRRARAPLTLHNGFIQVSTDEVIEKNIAKPFWEVVADPLWRNVDIDMKEALDRRDSNDKDPALFAAKALESAIKIISDQKGWSSGKENGASNYIDNLVSKNNGRYIDPWEADILKDYFRKVRNTLGHGPGSNPMPKLSIPQTDWAIETSMSWVRTLIRRL